jgi:hypothetical protein
MVEVEAADVSLLWGNRRIYTRSARPNRTPMKIAPATENRVDEGMHTALFATIR